MNVQITTAADIESIILTLSRDDIHLRQEARAALEKLGKPAVPLLIKLLQSSKADHVRWEAAKTLTSIGDERAIPALVKALEDRDQDVAWLAAVALRKFKIRALKPLLHALINDGEDSVSLRQGAHHILKNQKANGMTDLIISLTEALEPSALPELMIIAATALLKRINAKT